MNDSIQLKPVLLLAGDDAISREKAEHDALAAITQAYPDVVIERFDSEQHTIASFTESMLTPSMFQTMRIFVLREVHTLKKADLDMLNDVFLYKLTDQFLILETSRRTEKKGKSKTVSPDFVVWLAHFLKLVAKESDRFFFTEFLQPPEWDTAKWVVQQTPYLTGRAIGMKEAQYLIDLAGNDTATLYSELQKIDVHLPEGKPISRTAITTITGATRQMTPYELAAAVGKKDMVRVLEIIDSLYTGSVYVPQYIAALFRHFWAMYRIRTYAADFPNDIKNFMRSNNREIQGETGLRIGVAAGLLSATQIKSIYPVMVKSNIVPQAMSFSPENYTAILGWLKDYDIGIKTGRINDSKTGFQILCYKISTIA